MTMVRAFGATRSLLASASVSSMASAATVTTKTKETSGSKSISTTKKARGSLIFDKEVPVSPAMSKFLGVKEVSRNVAVKKIWDYVKQKQLQNKRKIMCDDNLKTIFAGKDEVGMLEVGKLLSAQFIKPK